MKSAKKIALVYLVYKRRKYKRELARTLWIHPLVAERSAVGAFYTLFEVLRGHETKFFNYFRMTVATFDYLLQRLDKHIARQETNMRQSIPPAEMLAVTVRYLASGMTFTDLHYVYRLGTSTIRKIIKNVCKKIREILLDECIPPPSGNMWNECEAGFAKNANFPNCFGAIDGKHIRIVKPHRSGSLFYNYKHFFSVVLLAVVDTSYCFRYVDVGAYGKECDSSVFKESTFFHALNSDSLHIPDGKCLPQTTNPTLPYVLVGDEAFGLSDKLLRPFGGNNLTQQQRVFNYRLSRARRYVECGFGIFSNKWRIFHRPINVHPNFTIDIVKACCILHNLVRMRDGFRIDDALEIASFGEIPRERNLRGTKTGKEIRDYFTQYFNSSEGSVPWQLSKI